MTSKASSKLLATMAAKRILGCYSEIPGTDKQVFSAGLIAMLAMYPQEIIELAADPAKGIPAKLEFLNLAAIGSLLEQWDKEADQRKIENSSQRIIRGFDDRAWHQICNTYKRFGLWSKWGGPDPMSPNCECPQEILKQHDIRHFGEQQSTSTKYESIDRFEYVVPGDLANVFVPHDHARYPQLCKWAETADSRLWKFGKSSDNRDGIWVNHHMWGG